MSCITCQKSLKGSCILKLKVSWKISYRNYLQDSEKIIACLINMLEKWKNTLDKRGFVCAMFIDLSKTFDAMNHDLLIAKLGAHGFQKDALSFMKSYLTKRRQRVRVNSNFSA